MASFPELHGEAVSGKTKTWSIRVLERGITGIIETTHGYVDGKKQVNEKIITVGKNIGKKNETTPLQQCIAETKRKWTDKHEKESYQETIQDEASASASASASAPDQQPPPHQHTKKYFPMLAHTFEPATTTAKSSTS